MKKHLVLGFMIVQSHLLSLGEQHLLIEGVVIVKGIQSHKQE